MDVRSYEAGQDKKGGHMGDRGVRSCYMEAYVIVHRPHIKSGIDDEEEIASYIVMRFNT